MGDAEVQHQRHRARRIRKVGSELYVSTMLTPVFSHLLRLDFLCCVEKVSELVNRPVVCLFGTRMSGTSTEMITKSI